MPRALCVSVPPRGRVAFALDLGFVSRQVSRLCGYSAVASPPIEKFERCDEAAFTAALVPFGRVLVPLPAAF